MTKPRCVFITGPLAPYSDGFGEALADRGYLPRSAHNQQLRMAQLSSWLASHELGPVDITVETVEQFLKARPSAGYSTHLSLVGMSQLLDYLRSIRVVPLAATTVAPAAAQTDAVLERYTNYLVNERGLCSQSVVDYLRAAKVFFAWLSTTAVDEFGELSSAAVNEYVLLQCQRSTHAHAKRTTSRLRSLLRFLFTEGLTDTALAPTVPPVANRADSLPQALSASDVALLLRSCDGRAAVGRRDFAILTVLARLGLRAGEVAAMRLSDIDWRVGEVVVHGKGSRIDRLPLPVDVGDAIVGWLQEGRPRRECPYVFTRIRAPHGPLSVAGISVVVARACKRAGLPTIHAHRLRHTAATDMLRAGGSLAEVGQVLRHASQLTTSIYAKVDQRALSTVIQPWPGSQA